MSKCKYFLFGLLFYSCGESSSAIEKVVRFKSDSIFAIESQFITKEQDSLCVLRKQASMQYMLDSILIVRKEEIIHLQKGL